MSADHNDVTITYALTQILSFIKKRDYVPGERLPSERDMAQRLSVGRGLIREALTTLETLRYLERRPNSGVFLHKRRTEMSAELLVLYSELGIPLDLDDIQDSIEIQRMLSAHAVELACLRRTQQDVEELQAMLDAAQTAIDLGQSIAEQDEEFHAAVFRASHNNVICRLMHPFFIVMRHSRKAIFEDRISCIIAHSRNVKLLQSIAARDAAAGIDLITQDPERIERGAHPG